MKIKILLLVALAAVAHAAPPIARVIRVLPAPTPTPAPVVQHSLTASEISYALRATAADDRLLGVLLGAPGSDVRNRFNQLADAYEAAARYVDLHGVATSPADLRAQADGLKLAADFIQNNS